MVLSYSFMWKRHADLFAIAKTRQESLKDRVVAYVHVHADEYGTFDIELLS